MRYVSMSALAGGLLLGLLAAGGTAQQPPEDRTGLKVGARAPAFTLKDQRGQERSLAEFQKKGRVVLVFYRSASW